MTKLKSQPWYKPHMENKYPSKDWRTKGLKFIPGKFYTTTTYYGNRRIYLCVKRSESGFIFFKEYNYWKDKRILEESHSAVIRRKPEKGWEGADERVAINKGTFGRVCWTGGCTLYARDAWTDKSKR